MSNLEKLGLYLTVFVDEIFIDENHLQKNILNHMPLLNQFKIDTCSNEFFIRIPQSFPFMEKLSVTDCHPQNKKQSYKSMNGNHNPSIVKYFYLSQADIE
ncbi:unnamed protein product [Rotaria magnacalcarata]|uniref:Uncharacterized protein n=1 Tax=Rotaria magnacalcarata TaxID=392030 RepID=A0A819GZT4_9BILA|nr:unnamed protein product [Rotaria magnacalcarata]CAF3791112.1 unnamed protein product [Rotaria magnacalcarata]CAF3833610.1 unnamed protein product [Rotaria magnacalcarata]CAF3887730.1 unnamed protein product [Rotaria magnacalcarata]